MLLVYVLEAVADQQARQPWVFQKRNTALKLTKLNDNSIWQKLPNYE